MRMGCAGLEIRLGSNPNGGSNPSPSANKVADFRMK